MSKFKKTSAILLVIFIISIKGFSSIPDHRDLILKNFNRIERTMVKYIVSLPKSKTKSYLNIFKPYYQNKANFTSASEYEQEIKKYLENIKSTIKVNTYEEFNQEEFRKICIRYMLAKLYSNLYVLLFNEHADAYRRRDFNRGLEYLERKVYSNYATAKDLIGDLDEKLEKMIVLLRNKAIYSIRRSFTFTNSGRQRFEQHTIGNIFKMLNIYKGKFKSLMPGIMVSLAKYRLQSTASRANTGFAIILNFAPILRNTVIKKIKNVPITVTASSGIELIKELFNTASEQMVAMATIERLSSSVSTKQWKSSRISARDIVASKAFILGFRVLKKRTFYRKTRGRKVKYLQATVSAKIGLPKLKDIAFSPYAKEKLKKYKQMVKTKRRLEKITSQGGHHKRRGNVIRVEEPLDSSNKPGGETHNKYSRNRNIRRERKPEANYRKRRPLDHPDNDDDLPDVIKKENYYRSSLEK